MILYISPFFHPEPISTGKYNTALVQALRGRGAQIVVVTSYPTYPHWRPEHFDDGCDDGAIVRGGLHVRYPSAPVLRRLVLEAWFAAFVAGCVLRHRDRVERIVCVLPPSGFVLFAHWLLPRRVKRIGIVHDLQGVHARSSDSRLRKLVGASVEWVERRVFRRFDRLLFLSESMRDHSLEHYGVDASSCRVCYPFVTLSGAGAHAELPNKAAIFARGFRHVVYSGALGEKQDPVRLVALMNAIAQRHPTIMCHVFSAGPAFEQLKARGGDPGIARVRLHDLVPEAFLADLYRSSDVQVIPQACGTGEAALPSKLPNLGAAGVPIVAVCDPASELGRLVGRLGGGVSEWNEDDFERAILAALERPAGTGGVAGGSHPMAQAFDIRVTVDSILEGIG